MSRTLVFVVFWAATAASCSSAPPPPASSRASEIDALEKQLANGDGDSVADQAEPAAADAARPAPNAEFQRHVEDALAFLSDRLPQGVRARNQSQFDADLKTAREMVAAARDAAQRPAEKNAAVLLTAMLIKDKERHTIAMLSGDSRHADTVAELAAASSGCRSELDDWMSAAKGEMPILEVGPCLQESQTAIALLGGR